MTHTARPAVFFDRDNTLIVNDDYLTDPANVRLVDGAAAAVARARAMGYAVVTVSNQSGVAKGLYQEADIQAVDAAMDALLAAGDPSAVIDRHEYCPHHPSGSVAAYAIACDCRKPAPGMITRAAAALGLDLSSSWLIGDAPRDTDAGKAAGLRTILLRDAALPPSPAAELTPTHPPDFIVSSLKEAIDVLEHSRPPAPTVEPVQSSAHEVPAAAPAVAATPPAAQPMTPASPPVSTARLEALLDQVLTEMRRRDHPHHEFSVSRLMAGITQVLALASLFVAYLNRGDAAALMPLLLLALVLQTMTATMVLMGMRK